MTLEVYVTIHLDIISLLCKNVPESLSLWGIKVPAHARIRMLHVCLFYTWGCVQYGATLRIPLSPWTPLFHLICRAYVWPLFPFGTQENWKRKWRIPRWRTFPRNRSTSSDIESCSCPASWSRYLPHTLGTLPYVSAPLSSFCITLLTHFTKRFMQKMSRRCFCSSVKCSANPFLSVSRYYLAFWIWLVELTATLQQGYVTCSRLSPCQNPCAPSYRLTSW